MASAANSNEQLEALPLALIEALFDHLPRAPFFVKDKSLRYVSANKAMLELCGVRDRSEMLGRTARDFFPDFLARRYEALDLQVMRTRRPIRDQLDLSISIRGRAVWLLFERWPVMTGRQGKVQGVAATSRNLDAPDRRHPTYERLAATVELMQNNFRSPLDVDSLARRVGISASQLERDFKTLFGLSPQRYLTKIRIETALALLQTDISVAAVAQACGFSDQSAFTRRFRLAVGLSPREYRSKLKA